MNNNNSNYSEWFREIKEELLLSEPQNIAARAQCCQNIINESISHLNMQLGLSQLQHTQSYQCAIDARAHLKFLMNWPGLRIGTDSSKAPRSKREYEKKAKNWLNGRRAPNYGKTLFPQFISEAEQYANKVTKYLINDSKKQSLYYKILIYKILAQLCGCSVSLNEQAKKAPFFCKNSIERKGKLKEILQAYAYDHQYIQGFPSCFEEAIDYFENKSNQYFAQYRQIYISGQNNNNNNNPSLQTSTDNNNNNTKVITSAHNQNNSNNNTFKPKIENGNGNSVIDGDGDTVIDEDENSMNTIMNNCINDKQQTLTQTIHNKNNNKEMQFWKSKAQHLQQQLETERNKRIEVEKERDNLQQLFNLLQSNLNVHVFNNQNQNNISHLLTMIPQNNNNNTNKNTISNIKINNIPPSVNNTAIIPTHTHISTPIQYGIIATPPKQFNVNTQYIHNIAPNINNNNNNMSPANINNAFSKSLTPPQQHTQYIHTNHNYNANVPTIQTLQNLQTLHNLQNIQKFKFQNMSNNNMAIANGNNNNQNQIGQQMAASLLRILQSD